MTYRNHFQFAQTLPDEEECRVLALDCWIENLTIRRCRIGKSTLKAK